MVETVTARINNNKYTQRRISFLFFLLSNYLFLNDACNLKKHQRLSSSINAQEGHSCHSIHMAILLLVATLSCQH